MEFSQAKKWFERVERPFQITILLVVVGFISKLLYDNWMSLVAYQLSLQLTALTIALALILLAATLTWLRWLVSLRWFGEPVQLVSGGLVYWTFQLSTYVPGGVWQFMNLNYLSHKNGISKRHATASMFQHQFIGLLSAMIVFLTFGGLSFIPPRYSLTSVIVLIVVLLILSQPAVLETLFNPLLGLLNEKDLSITMSQQQVLGLLSLGVLGWTVNAVGFYFLVNAITPVPFTFPLLAILPGAWLGGYLLLLSPGGLGIREAFLIYLLQFYATEPAAIIISILARLWTLTPEIVFGVVFLLWHQYERQTG